MSSNTQNDLSYENEISQSANRRIHTSIQNLTIQFLELSLYVKLLLVNMDPKNTRIRSRKSELKPKLIEEPVIVSAVARIKVIGFEKLAVSNQ